MHKYAQGFTRQRDTVFLAAGGAPSALSRARAEVVRALSAAAHQGIIIGLSAVGVMATACILLGGAPPVRLLAMAFCVATPSYALDRLADMRRDAHLTRTRALERSRWTVPISLLLFGVAVGLGLTSEHPLSGVLTLLFPASVALYVVPWTHILSERIARSGVRRIKDIPLAKAFYVPACWTLLVLWAAPFFPAARARDVAFAMAFLFPSLFITVVACDIRDEHADRAAGILTFPVLLRRARTLSMLRAVQVSALMLSLLLCGLGLIPGLVLLFAPSGLLVFWCLLRFSRPDADIEFFGDVVFDLLWLFQPVPALVAMLLSGGG